MAAYAALAQRFVLEHKWAALRRVTLETRFVLAQEAHTSTFERLGQVRSAPFDHVCFVGVVAIGTTHFSLENRMVMGQLEVCPHLQMALETGVWRFFRVNNRVRAATALDMQAARSMTRLAAHVLGIVTGRLQAGVGRGAKIARDCLVASLATLRANKFRPRNARRRDYGATCLEVAAREEYDG